MPDNVVEKLFSLFAPSDRAEALAGDLAEERQQRGSMWYWVHVVRVTFVLWRRASMEAPRRMLALTLATGGLFAAPAVAGIAAVMLFPELAGSVVSWIALSLFWWGGAGWTGASVVMIEPRRGMAACALVAATGGIALIALAAHADPQELTSPVGRMFFIPALGTTIALLTGGALASRRTVVIPVPFTAAIGPSAMPHTLGRERTGKVLRRPIGIVLLSGAFLFAGVVGMAAAGSVWPRTSSKSPLAALYGLVWSCTALVTAVLVWRRSRLAPSGFLAAIGLLLFPASFISPDGRLSLPLLVVIALVAFFGHRYLKRSGKDLA